LEDRIENVTTEDEVVTFLAFEDGKDFERMSELNGLVMLRTENGCSDVACTDAVRDYTDVSHLDLSLDRSDSQTECTRNERISTRG
jgi:hypothetical protein